MVKFFVLLPTFHSEILKDSVGNCEGKTWNDVRESNLKILEPAFWDFRREKIFCCSDTG